MAPEQCDARGAIRPATDVWALGLIGFYVLTGRHYWLAANDELVNLSAIVRELLVDPIEPASLRARSLRASIAPTIDPWFARCLERDAAARFVNARDACHAFVAALHSAAPQALSAEAFAPTVALAAVSAAPACAPGWPVVADHAGGSFEPSAAFDASCERALGGAEYIGVVARDAGPVGARSAVWRRWHRGGCSGNLQAL
jgi:hypothetical protein